MNLEGFKPVNTDWNGYVDSYDHFTYMCNGGIDFYDTDAEVIYFADMGDDNLYGFQCAVIDEDVVGDEDPVNWAIENLPAPGTGVSPRLQQLSIDDMYAELQMANSTMLFRRW